jgi:hypothetical protein
LLIVQGLICIKEFDQKPENIENMNEKNRISPSLPRHKETILFCEKVNIEKEE